ncbi:FHS family L-fucose permease-like MFS transporter [Aquimarina sp. MAR_2010_214]|uniref:sugar MFS transporter n=1 Tax=Aquimarina sp. MAR_2010_214 TaxID=1250026 RepID=UPI000C709F8D|nr:sugar MFS transporter [Aquimarina sp. MAR_2010_214]PKV52398.1 FHS family L-fucose permease-like MFS transporter [Aquimarina sp. MAR_2010_214]
MKNSTTYKSAFIFLTSLFFLWGFITVLVDSLIPRLREVFTLNYFQAGLVQFAFFGAYFLLSIPSGFILSKIGYKKGIILGLLTLASGCLLFYPAASYREFSIFMLAYFVVASGITILQVAANPYVAVLGPEEGASSRLNLSQAFNSLGTTIAPAIGAMFILSDKVKNPQEIAALNILDKENYYISEAAAVQSPFIGIAIFVAILAFAFIFIKLPKLIKDSPKGGYLRVLQSKSLVMGAIGIFVYVGAEVAIGSYLINYFLDMNLATLIKESTFMKSISEGILGSDSQTLDNKAIVGAFVTFYWSGAMIGRFIGAHLTKIIKPAKVLSFFAIGAVLLILVSISTSGFIAMWSILAVGLFNSIMFPTIFSLSIEGLDDLKPQASGVLCTMIVGGAIIPPLFGLLSDQTGFKTALILVLICYIYIVFYGRRKANS